MKQLKDFKALLFDIDGTLSNTKSEITPETVTAINALVAAGYKVGVCTGRGAPAIKNKVLPLFPKDSIHIATGGSQLINSDGKVLWEELINQKTVEKLKQYIDNSDLVSVFMKADAIYAKEPILSRIAAHPWNQIIKDIKNMKYDGVGAIYVSNIDKQFIEYISADSTISFKKMVGNSGNNYVDITSKGINKAVTLKKWAQYTGIPTEKIIGFGDSENDLEFLQECGFSVAMDNAPTQLKEISDKVIGHTDENAVAQYLQIILKGENL
jgi:Cof subfamily protein (haloacid dehalogenase superfamily)